MKKRTLLLAVLALTAAMLTSCFSTPAGSGSSSDSSSESLQTSSASATAYNPKDTYKQYGGTIDLKATADLSKVAFCVNDKDGCRLVVNTGDGDKTVYTSDSGLVVYGTQWSPDGKYVSFFTGITIDQKLMIYSLASDKVTDTGLKGVGSREPFYETSDIWSGDSAKVLGYSENGNGYYDLVSGKAVYLWKGGGPISFSPDGKLFTWGTYDSKAGKNIVHIRDIAAGTSKEVFSTPNAGGSNGSMFGPVWLSSTEFLVSDFGKPVFHKVDVSTGAVSDYLTGPYEILISPDRNYLAYQATVGYDMVIKNAATGVETVVKDGKKLGEPVWSYDSKQLLLCNSEAITILGLDGKQIGETIKIPASYGTLGFSTPVYTKDGLWYEGKV